ncbi:MAG: phosphate ABC transporter substrate-binding protein [Bacillota bacterium]|nr:phosphate ABC transporter substrate-binding protein [Bacillota bacterium]
MKPGRTFAAIISIALVAGLMAGCGGTTPNGSQSETGKITVVGSTSVGPYMDELSKLFMGKNPGISINVEQVGSGQGIAATKDGSADIGMSSRELKDEEKPLNEYKLCLDGIAIVVHPDNPVSNLTKEQVKKIYLGEITNWKDVGGNDAPINLYTREASSGTRGAFEELVLGKDAAGKQITIDETICAAVLNSTGNLGASVGNDKNAIGYMSLGIVPEYIVKAIKFNGVDATPENVKNKTYALQRPFLLLTKNEPTGIVKDFLDFCLSSDEAKAYLESQKLIIE